LVVTSFQLPNVLHAESILLRCLWAPSTIEQKCDFHLRRLIALSFLAKLL